MFAEKISAAPILAAIANQTVKEGENVTFDCEVVISDTPPMLQWLKHYKVNGSYMNENNEPYVDVLQVSSAVTLT